MFCLLQIHVLVWRNRYIALKSGYGHGSYNFSFLSQNEAGAIVIRANYNVFSVKEISSEEANNIFPAILDDGTLAITGYTGDENNIFHLACQYLKVKISEYTHVEQA